MSDTYHQVVGSLGESLTIEQLESHPYEALAKLQMEEPVSWVPALGAWLVTGRDEAVEAMRDAGRFTVDDPRFTTARVLGDSMLNLDGPEHARHRSAFAEFFRPTAIREGFDQWLKDECRSLLQTAEGQSVELRTQLAGPLAVSTIIRFLGLKDVSVGEVLGWYRHISDSITALALDQPVSEAGRSAVDAIRRRVTDTLAEAGHPSLVRTIHAQGILTAKEVAPAAVVVMFGAIETSEGMTANALWHLFRSVETLERVRNDRTLVPAAVEESLRLEPAAAVVDRYTTAPASLGGTEIPEGELVTISLLASNRDPAVFSDPTDYDIDRENLRQHVTFLQGPHACIGLHLARAETAAAIHTVLDAYPHAELDQARSSAPEGLIFRKPAAVWIRPR